MDLDQAKLFARITKHVKGVGAMDSTNGTDYGDAPGCFMCEAARAGIIKKSEYRGLYMEEVFERWIGLHADDKDKIALNIGDYKTGTECYEIAKKILVKYGYEYLLDEVEVSEYSFRELMDSFKTEVAA